MPREEIRTLLITSATYFLPDSRYKHSEFSQKNPTLGEFCFAMIGRADIEGSKSNVAMNAWLPQASYPCGNFSDTSCLKPLKSKGSIGPAFAVCIHTENQNQASFCPFALREVSVPTELALGHLRYALTDVPPQSNSPPDAVYSAWSTANHKSAILRLQTSDKESRFPLY